ncbi:MAG: hypothetical protein JWN45_2941 [Acidobacteriaceae bacterium]|nr:hypothetical protein [Acidobacteriaceae bacterium]
MNIRKLYSRFSIFAGAATVLLVLAAMIVGCDSSDYHKAVRATSAISSVLNTLQDVNDDLFNKAHLLDKQEATTIAKFVNDGTYIDDALIANLTAAKTLNVSNRADIVKLAGQLLDSIEKLNSEGILRIKNPDAQSRLAVEFAAMHASIAILQSLVKTYSSAADAPESPLRAVKFSEVVNESTNSSSTDRGCRTFNAAGNRRACQVWNPGRSVTGSSR